MLTGVGGSASRIRGVDGVGKIAEGRGRKSWLPPGTVEAVIHDTLHEVPRRRLDAVDDAFDGQAFQDRQGLGRPHLA
jgi:hypothetical protein